LSANISKKSVKTRRINAKKYNIIDANGIKIFKSLIRKEVLDIYPTLMQTNIEKPLGSYKCVERTKKALKEKNLEHLFGAYIEVI